MWLHYSLRTLSDYYDLNIKRTHPKWAASPPGSNPYINFIKNYREYPIWTDVTFFSQISFKLITLDQTRSILLFISVHYPLQGDVFYIFSSYADPKVCAASLQAGQLRTLLKKNEGQLRTWFFFKKNKKKQPYLWSASKNLIKFLSFVGRNFKDFVPEGRSADQR